MPSFDIVSKVEFHELTNAIDQANREVQNRYDFKNTNAHFKLEKETITLLAQVPFQLHQMLDILQSKLIKRGIDIRALKCHEPQTNLHEAKQIIDVCQGIEQEIAKKITKLIKESKLKVQGSIQGNRVRISSKKRDDLQQVISLLKNAKLEIPVQFDNFRD